MNEAERAEAAKNVEAEVERLCEQLAPVYSAKVCPRANFAPCKGPRCMLFMPQAEQDPQTGKVKITSGSCADAVLASQVGQVGNDLVQLLANTTAPGGNHIIRG